MTATNLAASERAKYERVWAVDEYRAHSPGEWALPLFRQMVRKRDATLLDLGCGTGRAGRQLAALGFEVTLADLVPAAVDVNDLPFVKINAWGRWPSQCYDWVYCCDVLEHVPIECVERTLRNIARHCDQLFATIHFGEDHFGQVIGHPLHLTVRPFLWWVDILGEFGTVIDARDLMGMGAFRVRFP